jgi:hypothetical protein
MAEVPDLTVADQVHELMLDCGNADPDRPQSCASRGVQNIDRW